MSAYKILNLIQGSPEWIKARYNYITASDVPVLFDSSPYKTALQLFEEKVMHIEAPVDESKQILFNIGHKVEVAGREWLVNHLGHNLDPAVIISDKVPELLASLDGFSEKEGLIAEFKYVGAESLNEIKSGKLPAHHDIQVQSQLLASGAEKCIYFAMNPKGEAVTVEIAPDRNAHEEIADRIQKFVDRIKKGEAPEPTAKDYVSPDDSRFSKLRDLKLQMDHASEQFEQLKEILAKEYTHPRIKAAGLLMIRSFRKGNVQYAKVPELKSVDLERYRGKAVETVSVKLEKGKVS